MRKTILLLLVCLYNGLAFAQIPSDASSGVQLSLDLGEAKNAKDSIAIYVERGEQLFESKPKDSSLSDFDFTLERLRHEIFLSDRQIRRRLKQFTGLSFRQYLREVRFAEARRLLESGEVGSVKELAYEVGMRDSKYFSKEFKSHFGKSPSEYL